MNFTLIEASPAHKTVFNNLMQFYIYDFSEFVACEVEDNGMFAAYPYLQEYFQGVNNRFAYLIKQDDKYAGFVLVKRIESANRNYFSIAEFFVMRKYRRKGMGKSIAFEIFTMHKGQWEVYQKETNKPAQVFWRRVIDEYTAGNFTERFEAGKTIQDFES